MTEPSSSSETPPFESSTATHIQLEQKLFSFDDMSLMSYSYRAPGSRGVVFFCHGLMEHTRTEQVNIDFFGRNRFSIFALDLPGHGLSATGEPDCAIKDAKKLIDTWVAFIHDVSSETAIRHQPKFWFGHSLGGTVGILVVRRVKSLLNGAIFSAPTVYIDANWFAVQALPSLAFLLPGITVQRLDRSNLSHDPAIEKACLDDPLCGKKPVTAQTGRQIKAMTDEIRKFFDRDDYPFLLYHGEADTITPKSNSELLFQKSSSKDKTIHIFPGSYHEVHNEPCRAECHKMIRDWLTPRLTMPQLEEPAI